MASKEFQKRFKNRSTVISSNGVLKTNPNNMIEKPSNRHVHSTLLDYESNSTPNPLSSVISPVSNSSDKSIFFSFVNDQKNRPFFLLKNRKNHKPQPIGKNYFQEFFFALCEKNDSKDFKNSEV